MLAWAYVRWWYGVGWADEWHRLVGALRRSEEYFSLSSLLTTLAQPFRQIDASSPGRGGLSTQFRAFVDRSLSRLVGIFARSVLIVVGVAWLALQLIASVSWMIIWPFLPVSLLVGVIFMFAGVNA